MNAKRESNALADEGRDFGRAHVAKARREQGAQDSAAVHGKGRDHVEHSEKQIHRREPIDHRRIGAFNGVEIADIHLGAGGGDQRDCDCHVHQRAGDGDQEFLIRRFRDALEAGHAADRQQRHVGGRHAESARREDVTEFMRHHAREQQDQKGKRLPRRFRTAGDPAGAEDPAEEQQKGDVDAHRRAGDRADIEGPRHERSPGQGQARRRFGTALRFRVRRSEPFGRLSY